MKAADLRFLFAYDQWATARVLAACQDIDEATWTAPNAIGDRGLAGILVHALGAHQRWRYGLTGSSNSPRPEQEPVPTVAGLTAAWLAEWAAMDAWLGVLDDAGAAYEEEGRPLWQYLSHVVNHGTQHRT